MIYSINEDKEYEVNEIPVGRFTLRNIETGIQIPCNVDMKLVLSAEEAEELVRGLGALIPGMVVKKMKISATTSFKPAK